MKKIIAVIGLAALVLGAHGQNVPTVVFDANTGDILAPAATNFVRRNVLNQRGITRQVDTIADLNATGSPYRSGEHVLVIDAGTFGNGGPVLFFHDSGSSDPTNTTDTVIATPGRWKAKRVFGSLPAFADVTGKPSTLSGYGITNALPLSAGSGAPLSGVLYAPLGIALGTNATSTNWPTGGGIGGITVGGSGVASNAASSAFMTAVRTNGDFAFNPASTTGSGTTLVLANSPSLTGTVSADTVTTSSMQVTSLVASALSAGRMSVTNEPYGVGWNGSTNVPTRDDVYDQMETKAPLASPAFTGVPTAPTASTSVSNTQVATTAFAQQLASGASGLFTLLVGNNATATFTTNTSHLAPRFDSRVWAGGLTWDQTKIAVPINCRIIGLGLRFRMSTLASPTGSNYVWSIRTNDIADVPVYTNSWPDSAAHASATSFSPINLNAGDMFAVKLTMPAWLSVAPVAGGVIDVYVERR